MMKKNNIIVIIMLILISLSFNVFANVILTDLGGSRTDDLNFGSPYTQGDINFTVVQESVSNVYYPHISSSLDFINKNYIYQYGEKIIRVYNAIDLSLISVLILPIDIIGQPMITNIDLSTSLDIVFVTDNLTNKFINFYTMSNGVDLEEVNTFEIDNKSTGQIAVPKTFCSTVINCDDVLIAGMLNNGSFEIINEYTNTYKVYNHGLVFGGFPSGNFYHSEYPYYSMPIYIDDINNNGEEEIIIGAVEGSANIHLKVFDSDGVEIDNSGVIVGSYTGGDNIRVSTVQIGSKTGSIEILASISNTQISRGAYVVFDNNLNQLHAELSTTNDVSMPSITDVNYDGINELCYKKGSSVDCENAVFTDIIDISVEGAFNRFLSVGEYSNNTQYQEILTHLNIKEINTTADGSDIIYNFTNTDVYAMIYQVELIDREGYPVKDLLYVAGTHLTAYYSSITGDICGDSVCGNFESILTCPLDCITEEYLSEVGESCENNYECNSGKCLYFKCSLKTEGESCENDNECVSNDCNSNDVCSKESLGDKISAIKKELGVEDTLSSNIISCIIIIIVMAGLIFLVAHTDAGGFASVLVGVLGGFIITFLLVIIGWCSAFVLFGFLLILIITGMLLILSKIGGD